MEEYKIEVERGLSLYIHHAKDKKIPKEKRIWWNGAAIAMYDLAIRLKMDVTFYDDDIKTLSEEHDAITEALMTK